MKAFITGATGFVGSHLTEHLLDSGDQVLGSSHSGDWSQNIPSPVRQQVPVFSWDVATGIPQDMQDRVQAFAPDVIYHLAAVSVPGDCGADQPTLNAIATNVEGTRNIITLAKGLAHRPRIVFTSSCYVYGSVHADNPVVSEESPCRPVHGYGITKLAAERELLNAHSEGLDVVIARAFQHSGPRQSPQMVLPDWARQLAARLDPIRAICLDTYLDISDVRDVVRAYRNLSISGHSGIVYNVGTGVCRRAGDLLAWMQSSCKASCSVVELSPGRRQHPIANIGRITAHTGWHPVIPIAQTLDDILSYWQQQEQTT